MLALMVTATLSLEESGSGSGTMSDQCPSNCPKPDRDFFEWFQMLAPIIASVLTVSIAIWQGLATFDSYAQRKEEKQSIQDILHYQRTTLKETITELAAGKDGRTTGLSATIRLRRFFDPDSELGRSGKTPPGRPFWRRFLCLKQPPPIHKPPFAKDVANFITAAASYDDQEWQARFVSAQELSFVAYETAYKSAKQAREDAGEPAPVLESETEPTQSPHTSLQASEWWAWKRLEHKDARLVLEARNKKKPTYPTHSHRHTNHTPNLNEDSAADLLLRLYKGGGGDDTLRKLLIDGLAETPTGTLRKHDFRMTDLSGGNFSTRLVYTEVYEPVDMTKAVFLKADLSEATFQKANCYGANFREAICVDTKFKQAKLQRAEFKHSILIRPSFVEAKLQGAEFKGNTHLVDAKFSKADIRGCDLSMATGEDTKWDGALYDNETVFPTGRYEHSLRKWVPFNPPVGTIKCPDPPTKPCLTSTRDFFHIMGSYFHRPEWTLLLPSEKTSSKLPSTWNEVHVDPETDKVYYYEVDPPPTPTPIPSPVVEDIKYKTQWPRPQKSTVVVEEQ